MIRANVIFRGFTLIELMVAVGLLGALASVALPWYGDSVRKSRVAEAVALAAPARLKAQSEALGIDLPSSASKPRVYYSCAPGMKCGQATWTYEAKNPNPQVRDIVRYQSFVVVNFTDQLAGSNGEKYSLVFAGIPKGERTVWECQADAAAVNSLNTIGSSGAPVQNPLPAKWAPSGCKTS